MAKKHIKEITQYVDLYVDDRTGIATVEDGRTGSGLSLHPNIDATGSVAGMVSRGYWQKSDKTVRSGGSIYNISRFVPEDDQAINAELLAHCRCGGNHGK